MYYLGIDLGGTNVAVGVVNDNNQIISKHSVPTEAAKGVDTIIANIKRASEIAVSKAGLKLSDISAAGIGSPGTVNAKTGVVDFASNLGFEKTPLASLVSNALGGIKVVTENDANVAAYAEYIDGAAKGAKDSVTITLGTGVGGGIIIDGKIYSGFNCLGAELGHMVIERNGIQCSCGRRGCWETYASVTGLIRLTKEKMNEDKSSLMWSLVKGDINHVNGKTSFDAMRAGDKTAKSVVDEYLHAVATGIADIINLLQPEVLCIGGGISKEGDYILLPVREHLKTEVFTRKSDSTTKVVMAKLGNDAGILGAAMLPKQ